MRVNIFFITATLIFLFSSCFASAGNQKSLEEICAPYRENTDKVISPSQSHDSIPYGEGLLWEIEAENGHKAYLFGTMHSQDRLVTGGLPPQVNLALQRSQLVVLEVIPDEKANNVFTDAIYYEKDQSLADQLPFPLFNKMKSIMSSYGYPVEMAERIKPWAAFSLIGRPKPVRAPTLDTVLFQSALQRGKRISALESMEELTSILNNIPPDDQIEILTDTICNHKQILSSARELRDLYIDRNLAGIVLMNQQPHHDEEVYQRYVKRMIKDRNKAMFEKITRYIQEEALVFIAVGASHLPDQGGLLKLLSGAGFQVKQLY